MRVYWSNLFVWGEFCEWTVICWHLQALCFLRLEIFLTVDLAPKHTLKTRDGYLLKHELKNSKDAVYCWCCDQIRSFNRAHYYIMQLKRSMNMKQKTNVFTWLILISIQFSIQSSISINIVKFKRKRNDRANGVWSRFRVPI